MRNLLQSYYIMSVLITIIYNQLLLIVSHVFLCINNDCVHKLQMYVSTCLGIANLFMSFKDVENIRSLHSNRNIRVSKASL